MMAVVVVAVGVGVAAGVMMMRVMTRVVVAGAVPMVPNATKFFAHHLLLPLQCIRGAESVVRVAPVSAAAAVTRRGTCTSKLSELRCNGVRTQ